MGAPTGGPHHPRQARGSHFGPRAKGAGAPLRQDAGNAQVIPSYECSSSSAVPPAARGVDRRTRPGPADPSLSTHQRRSTPGSERGRYRVCTDRARARPPGPYLGGRPRTDLAAASLGRRELVRPGRGSLPVRPHLPLAPESRPRRVGGALLPGFVPLGRRYARRVTAQVLASAVGYAPLRDFSRGDDEAGPEWQTPRSRWSLPYSRW